MTRAFLLAVAWLALPSPAGAQQAGAQQAGAQQPANVGDAKIAAAKYHDSGAYADALATVGAQAKEWLLHRAGQVRKPALILDVDETALSNWAVIKADDFGRVFGGPCDVLPDGPCGWVAWDLSARSVAIAPTLELYRAAKTAQVAVFFISGRDEHQREATVRNLNAAGFSRLGRPVSRRRWRPFRECCRFQDADPRPYRGGRLRHHRKRRRPALPTSPAATRSGCSCCPTPFTASRKAPAGI